MDNNQEMSFWDHLEALRWTLFHILIALAIAVVAIFIILPDIFDPFVLGPTDGSFFLYRWLGSLGGSGGGRGASLMPNFSGDYHIDIININVATQFLTHITTSLSSSRTPSTKSGSSSAPPSTSASSGTSAAPSSSARCCSSSDAPSVTVWSSR